MMYDTLVVMSKRRESRVEFCFFIKIIKKKIQKYKIF